MTNRPTKPKPKWSGLWFSLGLITEFLVMIFGLIGWFTIAYGGNDTAALVAGITYGACVLGIVAAGVTAGVRRRKWAFAQGALAAFVVTPLFVILCSALAG